MKENSSKILSVNHCLNLDKKVDSFILGRKGDSPSPHFFNTFRTKKSLEKSKPGYKTSLADWRQLYHNKSPSKQTQTDSKWFPKVK